MSSEPNKNRNQTALVTGATGFIGGHLHHSLKEKGYRVKVFSRRPRSSFGGGEIADDWVVGDFNDQNVLLEACKGVDIVFHVAGIAHTHVKDQAKIFDANFNFTKNIYAASLTSSVKRFIYMSSIRASDPDTTPYARSKFSSEQFLIESGNERRRIHVTILRPATVYGPGMRGALRTFIMISRWGIMPSIRNFKSTFSMVSVQDLCNVAILAAENLSVGYFSIYSVSDGESYTPRRIEEAVYRNLERALPRWSLPRSVFYILSTLAEFLSYIGIKRNPLGVDLYRNLIGKRETVETQMPPNFDFVPTATIETEITKIIKTIR